MIKTGIENSRIDKLSSSNKPNSYPPIREMAKNLATDVVKNVQSVVAGNPLGADGEEANKRKKICESCNLYNHFDQRCTKCGCNMAVKVYLKASNCPIGKW